MRPRLLAALAALALLPAAACSSCGEKSGAAREVGAAGSAGSSGGAPADAGGSAGNGGVGANGGSGAGGTGGATDAGGDAWTTDPAAWKNPPWNPPGCNVLRAVDLAKALPPLDWVPCNNGIKGCVLMDTSQLPGPGAFSPNMRLGVLAGVYQYGTRIIFSVGVPFSGYDWTSVIYEVGKGPIAAWRARNDEPCSMGRAYLWKGGVLQQTNLDPDGGYAQILHYGTVDQLVNGTASSILIDGTVTGNPQLSVLSGELGVSQMALELGPGGSTIYVWDMGSGKPVATSKPAGSWDDYNISVKGSEVLFERDGDLSKAGIALRRSDGSVVMLYQKPGVWVSWLASDRTDVVWQELTQYDGGGGKLELWTSPWADDPSLFKPRKVASLPGSFFVVGGYSGGGYYPFYLDDGTIRAVRLSDGAHIDIPAPPGYGWINPWGVVNGEIWCPVHIPRDAGLGVPRSIARIPLASLGAPTP